MPPLRCEGTLRGTFLPTLYNVIRTFVRVRQEGRVAEPDTAQARCSVCRGTTHCSFCNGDGYVVEQGKLTTCGVCDSTGACMLCRLEK